MTDDLRPITVSPKRIPKYPALIIKNVVPAILIDPFTNERYEVRMGDAFQYPPSKKYPTAKRHIYRDLTHLVVDTDLGRNADSRKNYPLYLEYRYDTHNVFGVKDGKLDKSTSYADIEKALENAPSEEVPKLKRFQVRLVSVKKDVDPYTSIRICIVDPLKFATLMSRWREKRNETMHDM